jgi:hypothetical protein
MAEFLTGLLYVVVGAAFLLAGYRLLLILIPLWGFFAGFELGAQGAASIFGNGFLATGVSVFSGLVFGAIFALLAYLFYWVAVVILGAAVGADLGSGLMQAIGVSSGSILWIAGFVGAVVAAGLVIVLSMPKLLLIVLAACGGASALIGGLLLWFGTIKLDNLGHGALNEAIRASWWWGLVWIALVVASVAIQTISTTRYTLQPYPNRV